ncbi:hypothetical protein [Falsiroseomonas sp. CW058]|uniref:hypothetical protein n=1 Tax=Falsiroseomonas sp. CW058 TaxID=3388664 RepID=UPI003D319333
MWDGAARFLYAGIAGAGEGAAGLRSRLGSHAGGRRSGDQFCIYVADRLVMPNLSAEALQAIGRGALSFDALLRDAIRGGMLYAALPCASGEAARRIEAALKAGDWPHGPPLLNPASPAAPPQGGGRPPGALPRRRPIRL